MKYEQVKRVLKKFKPLFPPSIQKMGVQAWRSIEVPVAAVVERRSIVEAHRVLWPAPEVADFKQTKILGPSGSEVLVEAAYTVISPGTERGQFLGLPGIYKFDTGVSFYPGYSGTGTVVATGSRVTQFQTGDRVAGRIRHSSRDVVEEQFLFHLPGGVAPDEAAFIELGIIGLQGIHKAQIKPGESVLVLGQGLIGQMANRLSHLAGAAPIIAVARTHSKAPQALSGGADRFLTVAELEKEGVGDGFDVVIEATGDPDIFPFAGSLARPGGRVLGLGTPRGRGRIDLGQGAAQPGVTFIGAHISGMPQRDSTDGLWTYRDEGRLFLDLLARGQLAVKDLITQCSDPCQAAEIYESLKNNDPKLIGIVFDWRPYKLNHS